ncbi:hypothetical protein N431DRAFT_460093 [Stipitochalara longipes BDJ]|nr:hypothetical protein N431DRAFT_460093 [Stipitochalara longipes BDJ]
MAVATQGWTDIPDTDAKIDLREKNVPWYDPKLKKPGSSARELLENYTLVEEDTADAVAIETIPHIDILHNLGGPICQIAEAQPGLELLLAHAQVSGPHVAENGFTRSRRAGNSVGPGWVNTRQLVNYPTS